MKHAQTYRRHVYHEHLNLCTTTFITIVDVRRTGTSEGKSHFVLKRGNLVLNEEME